MTGVRIAVFAALAGLALGGPARAQDADTGSGDSPALVGYGEDLSLRDDLVRGLDVRLDLGGWVVARVTDREVEALRRRGIHVEAGPRIGPGEVLFAVGGHGGGVGWTVAAVPGFRLVAVSRPSAASFAGRRCFHRGPQRVPGRRMLPPSTPPKFAATTVDPLVADLVAQVDQGALLLTVTDLVGIHNRRAD